MVYQASSHVEELSCNPATKKQMFKQRATSRFAFLKKNYGCSYLIEDAIGVLTTKWNRKRHSELT